MIGFASMVGGADLEQPTLAPYQGDLAYAFSKLSALGYEGVELMVKNPSKLDGRSICKLLDHYKLKLTGLCTGHIFGEDHLGLVKPDLRIDPSTVQRLKACIDFAGRFFEHGTMVNIGRIRGIGDPSRPEDTWQVAADIFRDLSDHAAKWQVRLILEPITRKEVNFIHSTQDGLRMVKTVDRLNFGVMLDTYHMFLEDRDLYESFYVAMPFCWHIHFSDSNRCWPGSAAIDYERIINILQEDNYHGYIATEIRPWPDPDSAARLSIESIRRFLPPLTPIQSKGAGHGG